MAETVISPQNRFSTIFIKFRQNCQKHIPVSLSNEIVAKKANLEDERAEITGKNAKGSICIYIFDQSKSIHNTSILS